MDFSKTFNDTTPSGGRATGVRGVDVVLTLNNIGLDGWILCTQTPIKFSHSHNVGFFCLDNTQTTKLFGLTNSLPLD